MRKLLLILAALAVVVALAVVAYVVTLEPEPDCAPGESGDAAAQSECFTPS